MRNLFLFLFVLLFVFACNAQQGFVLEPKFKRTFALSQPHTQGDVVLLHVSGLGVKQRLRLHKCGPKCNSAWPIATWELKQLPNDGIVRAEIPSSGDYYFWVEDFTEVTGKYGDAIEALSSETTSGGLIVRYNSPLVIVVK